MAEVVALLGGIIALIAALGGGWLKGRSVGRSEASAAKDADYRSTIERVKDADLSEGRDDLDAQWLHKRGRK